MQLIETCCSSKRSKFSEMVRIGWCTVLFALALNSLPALGQSVATDPTPEEIVRRMLQQNELRAKRLTYYESLRHYKITFRGLGKSMAAEMNVQACYTSGSGKNFQIIDQSGSHFLLDHVLKKLLETERQDSRQQSASLTPSNYSFSFQEKTSENGRTLYQFSVLPKVRNKLLYRGKIWIDASDFAVVRVEAQPAESPSFWIKKTNIQHVYAKNGEFWLPETNRSESKIRMGGSALLTIDYGSYHLESHEAASAEPKSEADHPNFLDVR